MGVSMHACAHVHAQRDRERWCAMAEAVKHLHFFMDNRVQPQGNSCGMCWTKQHWGRIFSTLFSPANQNNSNNASYSSTTAPVICDRHN
jgi:hypothetical protein